MSQPHDNYKRLAVPAGVTLRPCPVCANDAELWQYIESETSSTTKVVMSSIYGSGYVADIGKASQATPHGTLLEQIMDSRVPKTEREHAAAREIERLRAALAAQPVEPVAWVDDLTRTQPHCVTDLKYMSAYDSAAGVKYQPLYAAPPAPAAVPLKYMQIVMLWGHRSDGPSNQEIVSFAREVERAHGIAAAGDKP